MKKICIVFGTRPEIIKLSYIIKELKKRNLKYFLINSNQHYDKNMSRQFLKELKIGKIKYEFNKTIQSKFVSKFYNKCFEIIKYEKPNTVIVQGDTNSSMIGAFACKKVSKETNKKIKLIHVEAGLRSYDARMPEEINRIAIDHISDVLIVPTTIQKKNLLKEKINKKIYVFGNTISDSVDYYKKRLENNKTNLGKYFLITLHRRELLTNIYALKRLIFIIQKLSLKFNVNIFFPIHPFTKKILKKNKIKLHKNIITKKPLGYFEFLSLINNSAFILSDSGGIQEEACILGRPLITLRKNTERPETLKIKSNHMAFLNFKQIEKIISKNIFKKTKWKNPYGNKVSKKIVNIL